VRTQDGKRGRDNGNATTEQQPGTRRRSSHDDKSEHPKSDRSHRYREYDTAAGGLDWRVP